MFCTLLAILKQINGYSILGGVKGEILGKWGELRLKERKVEKGIHINQLVR